MQQTCYTSGTGFEITDADLKFYDKISPVFHGKKHQIPPPTLCPEERQKRRMAWRGKDYFFRKCGFTGKKQLSIYPPAAEMVTYSSEAFHGDTWNGLEYGRDFDFSRSFFEQFFELWKETPKHISNSSMHENCEYIINAHKNKDCYMADEIDFCRDCYYGYNLQRCEDVVNGFYVRNSKVGYELSQADNCYNVFFSHNVYNSSNCAFVKNCRKCTNCIFCTNLRNAEYRICNKPVSAEEFQKTWHYIFSGSQSNLENCRGKFTEFLKIQPIPAVTQVNTEDSTGDQLFNTKNCFDCFNIDNCRDCRYCTDIHYSKDCYDVHIYEGELLYEALHAGPKGYHQLFSHLSWYSSATLYSSEVHNCHHVFGCTGLKRQKHCILNKKYSQKEYESLVVKIIEHMQKTGEWGEFFPARYSPFGYNQTMAAYYFPLEKDQAVAQGFNWTDETEDYTDVPSEAIPETLAKLDSQTHKQVFSSKLSSRKYKVTPQEIKFHIAQKIPLPQVTPSERVTRFVEQNPRVLYERSCQECGKKIQTTSHSSRSGQVYCESCYLKNIY